MAKLVLTNINVSGVNWNSLTNVVNANNDKIEVALENTLSRDGTAPNFMDAVLDMNGYCIINVGCLQFGDGTTQTTASTGAGGHNDHGLLDGLEDNDHPQYSQLAVAETHTAGKGTSEVALAPVAGAVTLDEDDSNAFYIELTENTTITMPNGRDGQVISLAVKQDATGGWTLTLAGNVLEVGTIDTTASAYSHISFRWVGTGTWLAVIVGSFA